MDRDNSHYVSLPKFPSNGTSSRDGAPTPDGLISQHIYSKMLSQTLLEGSQFFQSILGASSSPSCVLMDKQIWWELIPYFPLRPTAPWQILFQPTVCSEESVTPALSTVVSVLFITLKTLSLSSTQL